MRQADGPAQLEHAPQGFPIRAPEPLEQGMFGEHAHRVETKARQHQAVIDGAGQCGPRNPHFREAPVAENQHPVCERVAQRADDGHPQHDTGPFLRGHVTLEHHDQQRRQQPEPRNPQVGLGQFGDDGFLTQQQQDTA